MNDKPLIMIVDDDDKDLRSLSVFLRTKGFSMPLSESDPTNVIRSIQENSPDIVLLDLHMPKLSGMTLLGEIKEKFPSIIVIITTGDDQISIAVSCTQLGAHDYFVKPIDLNRLTHVIKQANENKQLNDDLFTIQKNLLTGESANHPAFQGILTKDDKMKRLFNYMAVISKTSRPILILGETGTGKELFAKAIHDLSDLEGEYVTVNAAGFDDSAFSDSLFGHRKGAYTGAHSNREGLIKKANQGSLFLDEIGDLTNKSQVKLLRLLQENNYYPLGSDQLETSTARIITATHQNLDKLIAEERFRQDLLYRLKIHTINIPPLRERRGDIPLLAEHLVQKACQDLKCEIPKIPLEIYGLFEQYPFYGNVRELEILLFDAVINTRGKTLNIAYLSYQLEKQKDSLLQQDTNQITYKTQDELPTIKEATEKLINEALERTNNNQKKASVILGITRQALNKRLSRKITSTQQ